MCWTIMIAAAVAAIVGAATSTTALPCEEARMKCAYRMGCGMALQNYVVGCSAVLQGPLPTHCPEICQHSLIALTSTEEGKDLMNCDCNDDEYCEDQKLRSDICRPQVLKSISEPIVSCRVAQWICAADALCSTALEYYNGYCRAMFHGKKCTPRCNNSIAILRRQEKAAKLTMCKCDGLEDYDCHGIQRNMEKLCFRKAHQHQQQHHQNNQTTTTTAKVRTDSDESLLLPSSSPPPPPKVFIEDSNSVVDSSGVISVWRRTNTFNGILVVLVIVLVT